MSLQSRHAVICKDNVIQTTTNGHDVLEPTRISCYNMNVPYTSFTTTEHEQRPVPCYGEYPHESPPTERAPPTTSISVTPNSTPVHSDCTAFSCSSSEARCHVLFPTSARACSGIGIRTKVMSWIVGGTVDVVRTPVVGRKGSSPLSPSAE